MVKPFFTFGLVGLVLVSQPIQPASAAWPMDPSINVPLCTAANNQIRPMIATDGAGGAIVTWSDGRNGMVSGIYAQRVLANGSVDPAWPVDGRVLCAAANFRFNPEIVPDEVGGAIVTWYDLRDGAADIYAQRVLASGATDPNWPEDGRALCTAANGQNSPTIVRDGAGGAIVTWYDSRSGTSADIYAQHVLASGAVDPAWPTDGRALCTATKNQFFPMIVSDGAGGAIATWRDDRSSTTACGCGIPDVYAQHVLASGAVDPEWPVDGIGLCTADSSQYPSAIISDGAGGAIVTWYDQRSGNFDVYAQHVLASGAIDSAWPADGRSLCTAASDQFSTGLVADGAGGAIVAWYDQRSGDFDVYAQHVLTSGDIDPAWPADGRALCTASGDQSSPDMVSDGLGGAIISWTDFRTGQLHVYAQHVLASGDVDADWPANGRAICLAAGNQSDIATLSDGTGGAIVAWEDTRNGDPDVYAQRVQANGQLGGDVVGVESASTLALLFDSRPNPVSGGRLTVTFTLSSAAPAALDLFDVAGRRIVSQQVGSLGAGPYSLDLGAGLRLAPGLYFLRLRQGPQFRVSRVAVID